MNISDKDFLEREWPQHCGDIIKVIEKTTIKNKDKRFLFRCKFIKYPYEVLVLKQAILEGKVQNPQIEQVEFINKLWPQHCGDTLRVLKKTDEKFSGQILYECEFIKYPYKIKKIKANIISGETLNPRIEQEEFIGCIFKQNCGDSLKVLKKTDQQIKNNAFLFEVEFINFPFKRLARKDAILAGQVENQNLPWKQKENLKRYIQENFKEKPTLDELSKNLKIHSTTIGQSINKFGLQHLIHYSVEGSQAERDIKAYIQSLLPNEQISNTWTELKNGQEIDIFIQKLRLGFEFNGNYWHCNKEKEPNYHQDKTIQALSKGIYLMHIFEYEWQSKREICKSLIKSRLEIFDKKIGARSCKIKELSNQEYQDFCNQNHLQGQAGAKVKLGLICEDELVQIMSFGCPRFTDKYEWEIIRECSKLGYFIIGGKDKLWNYFVKKYSPNNCLSYCDFSKFNGKSYLRLGFKQISLNKPGFVWYDEKTNQTLWRNPSKHQEYKDKYLKIYDCGQLVFVWNC